MRKKITFLTFLLILFSIPLTAFANELDYTNGLFDNETFIKSNTFNTNLYDNDLSTVYHIPTSTNTMSVEFNEPMKIDYLYVNKHENLIEGGITITFSNGTSKSLANFELSDQKNIREVNEIDVIKIDFTTYNSARYGQIYELDFFGNVYIPGDRDGDGIPDHEDPYPDDPTNGDRDGDGIPDEEDPYPDDPDNTPIDSDGDGIPDHEDPYPDDPTNNGDTDLDGIPDDEDIYPDDPDNEQPEVENLNVEVEPGRADLSWVNPPKYFEKAIIYRMDLGEVTANNFSLSDLNPFKPMVVHAETYTPLFETNGTTFSDLTVKENNEYEYKVTTMYQGNESQGVTIRTVAPPPPPVDFTNTEIPFGVNELVSSGSGLLGLIGGFVLLALAFVFAPKVINLIKNSFSSTNPKADKIDRSLYSTRLPRQAREPRISTYQPREPRMSKRG